MLPYLNNLTHFITKLINLNQDFQHIIKNKLNQD